MSQSYWILPERFVAGEYPGHQIPREATHRVHRLLKAGINHFIDLTHPADRMRPYATIAAGLAEEVAMTVAIEHHPIVDMSIPSRPLQMAAVLDSVDLALNECKTVYLHCWGGIGRTGTVVGCWLVDMG